MIILQIQYLRFIDALETTYTFNQCRRIVTVRELARLQGFADDYAFHSEGGNVKTVRSLFSWFNFTYKIILDASTNWKCSSMACISCNRSTVYICTSPEEQPGVERHH